MSYNSGELKQNKRRTRPETEARYNAALELYSSTTLSVKEICKRTGTPVGSFQSYIHRAHRELMFARHGIQVSAEEARSTELRKATGLSTAAQVKYGDAIRACDNIAYVEYNVSQIARMFHVDPSSLGRLLRVHFPEIVQRREKHRSELGLNDNLHKGAGSRDSSSRHRSGRR